MSTRTKLFSIVLFSFLGIFFMNSHIARAADDVTLYTPSTKISVPPGESLNYSIDVINNSKEVQTLDISVSGLPKSWDYSLKMGSLNIEQLSVLPGEKKTLSLKAEVPLKINKGSYRFKVTAGNFSLPLNVIVTQAGTYKTEFTAKQSNMQGKSGSTFTFNAELKNYTADHQLYALKAGAPLGWDVTFKANYKAVTSVDVEANSTENIIIEIKPTEEAAAGTYKIPVVAETSSTSDQMELEVVITGSFNLELTTPTGLLSADITAGGEKQIELVVKNTGSLESKDIILSSSTPAKWIATFDPKEINKLEPGKEIQVIATIKADKKAIPGDYVTNLFAKTPETSSKAAFRISVKTPLLWGWVGVFIIIIALGSVYYLFRKFGRR